MKYIGIDIGATNLKAGLVDDQGCILATQKMKVAQIESPDSLARHMARMTEELARAVTISCGGSVTASTDSMRGNTSTCWCSGQW